MAERRLQTNSHCKNLIMYHLIFVCKYGRKVFSNHDFVEEPKLQISEVAKRYDFQIDTIDLDYSKPDHIHILSRRKHLWTRGYFCSTVGNVSAETVHKYLEKQGRNE